MGQCMSRKAAGAFAASAAAAHNRPDKMHKHHRQEQLQSPGDENNSEMTSCKPLVYTKGVTTSFGFRRRPTTAPTIATNPKAARRLANATTEDAKDKNGNGNITSDTETLTSNVASTGRSTPRLMPPKKEGSTNRVNRFGFRQPQVNRLNKVADLNTSVLSSNNNFAKPRSVTAAYENRTDNINNRNRVENNRTIGRPQLQAEKYMLQTTELPRPEPIRLIESKTAKTLANNNKKIARTYQEDKDGSSTEDSGVGWNMGDKDAVPGLERLNCSPTFGVRRSSSSSRNLEILRSGNTFNVRDSEGSSENSVALPRLPSAFNNSLKQNHHHGTTSHVREMALEYQRQHLDDNRRKISITSSEEMSDDFTEEKTYRERFGNEKSFLKSTPRKSFLKSRSDTSSTTDENEWLYGGEAMADDVSFSISSSDESREMRDNDTKTSLLHSLLNGSCAPLTTRPEAKNILLTLEDPKFAAVATAATTTSTTLLDDETLPVDNLLSYSESDDLRKELNRSSSDSKDINEKLTPPSPGTPTNTSNSLSLSDGKDDFLIDDEIADQPALVFEDAAKGRDYSMSESTSTMVVDSTPKAKRRILAGIEGSPLSVRNKKTMLSRTGSLDTLSPCESIASDDLIMDYDYSQSSGVEDFDRNDIPNHRFLSLDETLKPELFHKREDLRDWATILGSCTLDNNGSKNGAPRNSRLLWSRTGTPNSVPDSPKSVDSRGTLSKPRPSVTNSPLRLRASHHLVSTTTAGYESDDSVRLDRTNHTAMKQDIMSVKTMLIKLKRVLNESETHIPFDGQPTLTNGLFNGLSSEVENGEENRNENSLELAELRRQVLFLQGQLEDKERTVQSLQDEVIKIANQNYVSNSAPASTTLQYFQSENTCNAATQTDRVRPISAGPSLLNSATSEGNAGSLVSASESPPLSTRSRPTSSNESSKRSSPSIWRRPGEPPSPRYSSIPRRANSRTRRPLSPS